MIFRTHAMLKKAAALGLLAAGLGLFGFSPAAAADNEIIVPVHRAELISVPGEISEVIVANPDVADVFVHGTRKVSIVGKAIGTTSLRVIDSNSDVLRAVTIRVGYDIPAIRQTLYELFPYEDISVQTVNNNLALTGMVSSPSVAAKAVRIANEFMMAVDSTQRPRDNSFATNRIASEEGGDAGVINMLKVTSGQQVMLRVRVGEMQRNAMKQLGVNWNIFNPDSVSANSGFLLGTAAAAAPFPGATAVQGDTFAALGGTIRKGGATISAMINALERNNLFKLLAEPNLVAMSGEEAEFLAGGEFPIPIQAFDSQVTIEFKEFGVSVKFLPIVLSDSRIRITVAPEISEISDIGSITVGGFEIPSLSTRRAKTTVELAPGESFMIAGLLRDQSDSQIDQVPGLGEVPVLGSLFRSVDYQRDQTELVIAVTPYLVDPVTGDEVRLPTDGFRPPSMMEQFFYGALGSVSSESLRKSQTPSLEGPIGFMVD